MLEYVISYTNYTYAPATVTITDVIPVNTIFLSSFGLAAMLVFRKQVL